MNEFNGEIKSATVTQKNLAQALGLTPARINQLIDEQIVVRDEFSRAGRVMLFESLRNFFLSKKQDEGTSFWKERTLHEKAKREMAELKLKERQGELYEASTVERVLTELLTDFKNKMLGLGHKVAPSCEMKSAAQICQQIDSEVENYLQELVAELSKETFQEVKADVDKESKEASVAQ